MLKLDTLMAEATLTLAFAIFSTVGPSCGWDEAQMVAKYVGVSYREVVITDGSPLSLVEQLYPSLVVFSRISGQSDL